MTPAESIQMPMGAYPARKKDRRSIFYSLQARLTITFMVASILPLILASSLIYIQARSALESEATNTLVAVRDNKASEISEYFREQMKDALALSTHPATGEAINAFREALQSDGPGQDSDDVTKLQAIRANYLGKPDLSDAGSGLAYDAVHAKYHPTFKNHIDIHGYEDLFLIEPENGNILYSASKEDDFGLSLLGRNLIDSNLSLAFQESAAAADPNFTLLQDFAYYEPTNGPASFVATPILDNGLLAGVLIFQLSIDEINSIMHNHAGLDTTGETYLVGQDQLMRSDSRFASDSTVFSQKVDTPAVERALNGQTGAEITTNYQGKNVILAYTPLNIDDADWAIIVEEETSESLATAQRILLQVGGIIGGGVLLAIIVAFFTARGITRPVGQITTVAKKLAMGDLDVTIENQGRKDELGILNTAFEEMIKGFKQITYIANQLAAGNLNVEIVPRSEQDALRRSLAEMVTNLREQIQQIIEGINTLAISSSQITSTTAQLTASAMETSTAINETTTTVIEVRQTAEVSSQKANIVSESTRRTAEISKEGKKVTEDTIAEMNVINSYMETIAESIVRLSEKSQTIGQIIATVNDLADQSNLLAVNAAIEAAKAGEQGKGFTVVAQAIKSLSEQSKQATSQVHTILDDIQKATTTAVMTTEQGSKAAAAGVEQSKQAGKSIQELAESVITGAEAASQIAASTQEQFMGVDQVMAAMENIKQASSQNVDSAKQLDSAVRNIESLGQELKTLTNTYQV